MRIQRALSRLGLELRRTNPGVHAAPAFRPYVVPVSLAGVSFDFWVGDTTGKEWYNPEEHQRFAEHTETARVVQRGDRVLEIGSHHGFTAMLLSKLVGEPGFVLAVEPSPFNAMMVAAQVGLNRITNCQVIQAAASERHGNVRISQESNAAVIESGDGMDVVAVTADELDLTYGPFDVLKIDVEGFERQVLTGARNLLQRRPRVLLELHSPFLSQFGSTVEAVLGLLGPFYRGTFISRDARDRIHAYPATDVPRDEIVNLFLAFSDA